MQNFQFIFDTPPTLPTSCSPIGEVFAWSVWKAMELGASDIVLDESSSGLVVFCLDYRKRDKSRTASRQEVARFPHLRGTPLKDFPNKGIGVAAIGKQKKNVRVWTCQKTSDNDLRSCAILSFMPPPVV
jgi:hypothetical protein